MHPTRNFAQTVSNRYMNNGQEDVGKAQSPGVGQGLQPQIVSGQALMVSGLTSHTYTEGSIGVTQRMYSDRNLAGNNFVPTNNSRYVDNGRQEVGIEAHFPHDGQSPQPQIVAGQKTPMMSADRSVLPFQGTDNRNMSVQTNSSVLFMNHVQYVGRSLAEESTESTLLNGHTPYTNFVRGQANNSGYVNDGQRKQNEALFSAVGQAPQASDAFTMDPSPLGSTASAATPPDNNPQATGIRATWQRCLIHEGSITCNEALIRGTSAWHLKQHKFRANADGKFECPWEECRNTLGNRQKLIFHLQSHLHYGVRDLFVCNKCGKEYGRKDTLRRHRKNARH
ncbi:hypothetical protein GYMLUDRAFT_250477 [Collybiopsis luxurians FD-317 M1]|uniref:C2H2-type domain-containing protein n=1 Tax=Collybiopsis luxurians FD-317 M1 TaxID=944289 RepID=A0A0D0BFD4_9AGAR|nr:hypothetical protein GYMLUDRAFT_250477 [Collybiopsis luxurians FD-317 M1]